MRVVACAGLLLTGCFYVDPINLPPKIKGKIECHLVPEGELCPAVSPAADGYFRRKQSITFKANIIDPDGRPEAATFVWKAYQCEIDDPGKCDIEISDSVLQARDFADEIQLIVPADLTPGVTGLEVDVDVRDDRGAFDSSALSLAINEPPSVSLSESSRDVVGVPVDVLATYGDPDAPANTVTPHWDVRGPDMQPVAVEPVDEAIPSDPDHLAQRVTLMPMSTGTWTVTVTAVDAAMEMGPVATKTITVGPDGPPCLSRVAPVVPPDKADLPITDPTVFQVALVDDALDPYPPLPAGPPFGTTTFAWSILPPGAKVRQPFGTSNSVDFDPGAFTPGDILELRVEIFDRNHAAIPCADDVATCSLTGDDCMQRQTWRVEVR